MSIRTAIVSHFMIAAMGMLGQTQVVAEGVDLRVYAAGKLPNDSRLKPQKHLNDYFPFHVPASKADWEIRAAKLRRQVLVATDLWPLPERSPLNPVIHGKVQRPGFTVEKVYFEASPNHFVTGLLFRPDDGKTGKRPAVLCPHGHGGRLQDYGVGNMDKLIESGGEKFKKSGRYPKLARCAQLARMGCVVFIFDMLGYADSTQISSQLAHRFGKQRPEFDTKESWGLFSTQAELRLQSIMGIQTWNSVRCLDFLASLPDVDGSRIAVTGGSGGGTQTILLCAIDPRPIAAFPQGMVSTSMQGGCTCENCSLLRVGTGNVELAGLFAPKPQAMTAANDWTKGMMTKGYPSLRTLYSLYGKPGNVLCVEQLHFPHNYNYVTRAIMYSWFNKHMKLGQPEPIVEPDYEPLTAEEYTVWNAKHPKPAGGDDYERKLLKDMDAQSNAQLAAVHPKDKSSLAAYREVVGGAVQALIGRGMPKGSDIQRTKVDKAKANGYIYFEDILRLTPVGEEIPVISLFPLGTAWNGQVVIWIDGAGKQGLFNGEGQLASQVRRLIDGGFSVVGADLLYQGEFLAGGEPLKLTPKVANTREYAGYTLGYNHSVFASRVHDILTLISFVKHDDHAAKQIHLVGTNGAGAVAAVARAIAGGTIRRAAIDTKGFRFV
ncbi:MAG: acetylxylan esterase, partial [Planctomycetota bacterium]|nr:acetylxylan esterase [Planctomycetota bacterium]